MADYICIGQLLNLKKYDQHKTKLKDFANKEFFILKAKAINSKENHEGFLLSVEDMNNSIAELSTYSRIVVQQIKDLLLGAENDNGVFKTKIKCTLEVTPLQGKNGDYREKFKLI